MIHPRKVGKRTGRTENPARPGASGTGSAVKEEFLCPPNETNEQDPYICTISLDEESKLLVF